MNLKSFEKKEKSTAQIVVEVSAEEFDKAVNESYIHSKNSISVPGFRKGKAPRKVIEGMYGVGVFYEDAIEMILPSVFGYGVSESKIKSVSYPKIDDVKIEDDKSVSVTYTVSIYPQIIIGEYKGISAVKPSVEVTDEEIDSFINGERYKNSRFEVVEARPVIDGDHVKLDYTGYIDGETFEGGSAEDYELVIGSNTFIPGFELKMHGMMPGEERDLELQFPESYHNMNLSGKPVTFHVRVKEIKEQILPELDDEFAKDISEFDTMEEYRKHVEEDIRSEKSVSAAKQFEDAVLEKLIETVEGDIPEAMIDEYVNNAVDNFKNSMSAYGMSMEQYFDMVNGSLEEFRSNIRPGAVKNVKNTLALEKVAELENIEPTEEEIEAGIIEIGATYGFKAEEAKEKLSRDGIIFELKLRAATVLVLANSVAVQADADTGSDKDAEPETPASEEDAPAAE